MSPTYDTTTTGGPTGSTTVNPETTNFDVNASSCGDIFNISIKSINL